MTRRLRLTCCFRSIADNRRMTGAKKEMLMAFAPLDGALMPMPETQRQTLLIFFFGGMLLFVLSVLVEMGIDDGR